MLIFGDPASARDTVAGEYPERSATCRIVGLDLFAIKLSISLVSSYYSTGFVILPILFHFLHNLLFCFIKESSALLDFR